MFNVRVKLMNGQILKTPITPLSLLFSLFFFSVLFADFFPTTFGAYANQRVILSLSIFLITAWGIVWLSFRRVLFTSLAELWPFFLLLLAFIAPIFQPIAQSFYVVEPVFYALYFFSFGLLGVFLKRTKLTSCASQALLVTLVVSCFFYAAMTVTVYLFAVSDDFSHLDNIIPWGFVSIRYWSHIATWLLPLLPLALLMLPWKENRLWHLAVTFSAAIWWWVVFLSASRGSMVGLLTGFLFVWACFGKVAFPWMRLFFRFAIYGFLIWLVLSVLIPSLVFDDIHIRGIKAHSSGRTPLWQEAWAMSFKNFPFGMGPQSWLTHDILTEAYQSSSKFGHPHNMYLMWAAEYGWVSLSGLILLGGVALLRLWQRISETRVGDNRDVLWLTAFTASVTAALVHAGVSAVFIAPGSMLIGLVVLTVFWALISPNLKQVVPNQKRYSASDLAGYILVIAFLLVGSIWFREVLHYRQAMDKDIEYYRTNVREEILPRFWFHGNFPRNPSQMPQEK